MNNNRYYLENIKSVLLNRYDWRRVSQDYVIYDMFDSDRVVIFFNQEDLSKIINIYSHIAFITEKMNLDYYEYNKELISYLYR